MIGRPLRAVVAALGVLIVGPAAFAQSSVPQTTFAVAEIRVRGNIEVSEERVLEIVPVRVGDTIALADIARIESALTESGLFRWVEVRVRRRSLREDGPVSLIIAVQESARARGRFLFLPEIHYNEDEGFAGGGRVSARDLLGMGELLSVPATVGGLDRAALEITGRTGTRGRLGLVVQARQHANRHFDINDARTGVAGFWQGALGADLRYRLDAGYENVDFGAFGDRQWRYGAEIGVDTRLQEDFAHDAVVARAAWSRLAPRTADPVHRFALEAAGYRTLVGAAVLAVHARADLSSAGLPAWEKNLLGGMQSLRGYRAGAFAYDNVTRTAVELRVPVTAALSAIRFGVVGFWDAGTGWDEGGAISDTAFRHGVGVGLFMVAPVLSLNLDLGSDLEGSTRLHFGLGFRF